MTIIRRIIVIIIDYQYDDDDRHALDKQRSTHTLLYLAVIGVTHRLLGIHDPFPDTLPQPDLCTL